MKYNTKLENNLNIIFLRRGSIYRSNLIPHRSKLHKAHTRESLPIYISPGISTSCIISLGSFHEEICLEIANSFLNIYSVFTLKQTSFSYFIWLTIFEIRVEDRCNSLFSIFPLWSNIYTFLL